MHVLPVSLALAVVVIRSASAQDFPVHRLEVDSETTWQSDFFLAESGVRYEQEWSALRWEAAFTHNAYSLEYEPFRTYDLFGFNQTLREDRFGGQATARPKIGERLTLIASGGIYDGYQDYRRVWLANYYRQQYSHPRFPQRPGYLEPDPKGWNAAGGVRWEYWPEMAFAEARAGYGLDQVAPGFIEEPGTGGVIRGRSRLYTAFATLSLENVVSSRIRARNELRVNDTTDREVRWSWQGAANFALGERWVFRPLGGLTWEEPEFDAFWLGASLEFQAASWCALIASAEYYEDTGEVLDPFSFSTAAPALKTQRFTVGVRFTWANWMIKISGGPYSTDYEELPANSRAFTNLYRDRYWAFAQASVGCSF